MFKFNGLNFVNFITAIRKYENLKVVNDDISTLYIAAIM